MNLPSWSVYCNYKSGNYGVHALWFDLGNGLTIWFSYRTPVAFAAPGHVRRVRQNVWGPTTGKHLNAIDGGDKANRIDGETFERLLAEAIAGVTV